MSREPDSAGGRVSVWLVDPSNPRLNGRGYGALGSRAR